MKAVLAAVDDAEGHQDDGLFETTYTDCTVKAGNNGVTQVTITGRDINSLEELLAGVPCTLPDGTEGNSFKRSERNGVVYESEGSRYENVYVTYENCTITVGPATGFSFASDGNVKLTFKNCEIDQLRFTYNESDSLGSARGSSEGKTPVDFYFEGCTFGSNYSLSNYNSPGTNYGNLVYENCTNLPIMHAVNCYQGEGWTDGDKYDYHSYFYKNSTGGDAQFSITNCTFASSPAASPKVGELLVKAIRFSNYTFKDNKWSDGTPIMVSVDRTKIDYRVENNEQLDIINNADPNTNGLTTVAENQKEWIYTRQDIDGDNSIFAIKVAEVTPGPGKDGTPTDPSKPNETKHLLDKNGVLVNSTAKTINYTLTITPDPDKGYIKNFTVVDKMLPTDKNSVTVTVQNQDAVVKSSSISDKTLIVELSKGTWEPITVSYSYTYSDSDIETDASGVQTITNNATVKAWGYDETKSYEEKASHTLNIDEPNLDVQKAITKINGETVDNKAQTVYAGDTIEWTIKITNSGTAKATGLQLKDVLSSTGLAETLNVDNLPKSTFDVDITKEPDVLPVTYTVTYTVDSQDVGKTFHNTVKVYKDGNDPTDDPNTDHPDYTADSPDVTVSTRAGISAVTKTLVTDYNDIPAGVSVTVPTESGSMQIPVTEQTTGAKLLFKITVTGDVGAKFKFSDPNAVIAGTPTGCNAVANESGFYTLTEEIAVFYVTKGFAKTHLQNPDMNYGNTVFVTPEGGDEIKTTENVRNITVNYLENDSNGKKLADSVVVLFTAASGYNVDNLVNDESVQKIVTEETKADGTVVKHNYMQTSYDNVSLVVAPNALTNPGNIILNVYYSLDDWHDGDKADPKDPDSEEGGDGIPDKDQVRILYKVKAQETGTVNPKVEILTPAASAKTITLKGSTPTNASNYAFAYWFAGDYDKPGVDRHYNADFTKGLTRKFALGATYTYTAVFLPDTKGDPQKPDTAGDGIPDEWQVRVEFKSVNGDLGPGKEKVDGQEAYRKDLIANAQKYSKLIVYVTLYENGVDGTPSATGSVTLSQSDFILTTEDATDEMRKAAAKEGKVIPTSNRHPDEYSLKEGTWDRDPNITVYAEDDGYTFTFTYPPKALDYVVEYHFYDEHGVEVTEDWTSTTTKNFKKGGNATHTISC